MQEDKPVEVGQELDLIIQNIGSKGDGICKVNSYVVILLQGDDPLSIGQSYRAVITNVRDRCAFAEILE